MVLQSELGTELGGAAGVVQIEDGGVGGGGGEWEAGVCALVEECGAAADAELWVTRLAARAAQLDASNVGAMLAAGAGGTHQRLARALDKGATAAAGLRARYARADDLLRSAAAAGDVKGDAAREEAAQRHLLAELERLFAWLDADGLKACESPPDLGTPAGRARAAAAAEALRSAFRGGPQSPALRRLNATSERLRRLTRAKERLAAGIARHLNNLLIHLGNEASSAPPPPPDAPPLYTPPRHHAELAPYSPFMLWLKDMDEKAYDALVKVYVSTWSRVHERVLRGACDAPHADLDKILTLVEQMCDAEQDFCTQFLCLDIDVRAEGSDGERSEKSEGSAGGGGRRAAGGGAARKMFTELFPSLEQELVALVAQRDKQDPYGAMMALSVASRHVSLGGSREGRWSMRAAAAAAVAAKRAADKATQDRVNKMQDHIKAAQKRPKCGVFGFLSEFAELSERCEQIFESGRRADLERWYATLSQAMIDAIANADHPRTPRPVIQLENYHRLHAVLSSLGARSAPALAAARREAKARYTAALKQYVAQYYNRPLEKLQLFFDGVSEALSGGALAGEVSYRRDCSKHELKRVLALYPPHEVRRSLHRLYRAVERHCSAEEGLLQVVWRAMQEELLAQHGRLAARLAECYGGSGLAMPLTTTDILQAFSDIAQQH